MLSRVIAVMLVMGLMVGATALFGCKKDSAGGGKPEVMGTSTPSESQKADMAKKMGAMAGKAGKAGQ